MTTTLGFKELLDLPQWRPLANAPNTATVGVCLAYDLRNDNTRHPEIFQLASAAILNKYNTLYDDWLPLATPGLGGTFGAGADVIFIPDQGPSGTIAAGATTTSVTLTTALPAAVGTNQLATRGDGKGFIVRIIDNIALGAGKIEEREINGNTSGTTPILYFDTPLSFTPSTGARYEFLSGRVFMLSAGAIVATTFRWYDLATNSYGSMSQTNLPATIGTDSHLLPLSELYVPVDRKPGEGFLVGTSTYDIVGDETYGGTKNCLLATASAAGSITGQAVGGDASVLLNEYRNHQIRIVEDTGTPLAVGQRRQIQSHTAGASPVYTITPNWTTTPSANAKFVIEGWTDKVLLWTTANTTTYTYTISTNAWDASTTFAAKTSATGAGVYGARCFGLTSTLPTRKLSRHSYVYLIRGGNSNVVDLFDIAGAATGAWTENVTYGNKNTAYTTATCAVQDPITNEGCQFYICVNGTTRFQQFNIDNPNTFGFGFLPYVQGAATVGRKIALASYHDGATKISFVIVQRQASIECFQMLLSEGD
jgi:hypothetical protein